MENYSNIDISVRSFSGKPPFNQNPIKIYPGDYKLVMWLPNFGLPSGNLMGPGIMFYPG